MRLDQIVKVQSGTAVILKDFNTLEAMGEEYRGVAVSSSVISRIPLIAGFMVEPSEDVELMIVGFEDFNGTNDVAYKMYRKFVTGPAEKIDDPRMFVGGKFVDFQIKFKDMPAEDDPLKYDVCGGFPIALASGGGNVCIWDADPERTDTNYWARNCLVEVKNGVATVWFGWNVSSTDVDVVVG